MSKVREFKLSISRKRDLLTAWGMRQLALGKTLDDVHATIRNQMKKTWPEVQQFVKDSGGTQPPETTEMAKDKEEKTRQVTAWVEVMLNFNLPNDADAQEVVDGLEFEFKSPAQGVEITGQAVGDTEVTRDSKDFDRKPGEVYPGDASDGPVLDEPANVEDEPGYEPDPPEGREPYPHELANQDDEPDKGKKKPKESRARRPGARKMDAGITEGSGVTKVVGKGPNTRGSSDYSEIEAMIDELLKENGVPQEEITFYYERILADKKNAGS